ncbi:MAG: hypothetical protein AXA67_02190 [Methylothermaceae bacteria B42]|nr:MAG: hypothetical protein AXA67_02190 [Methylothermaceae bacteria B42]HHJ40072.1 hypothetical protein [Methylothermaceae bacterium]
MKSFIDRASLRTPIIFANPELGNVRAFDIDGVTWFVAKDVCDVLGLQNPTKALEILDDDERKILTIREGTPGNPNVNVITESGLYALILRSRKPAAKAFRKWVTFEVLPAMTEWLALRLRQFKPEADFTWPSSQECGDALLPRGTAELIAARSWSDGARQLRRRWGVALNEGAELGGAK